MLMGREKLLLGALKNAKTAELGDRSVGKALVSKLGNWSSILGPIQWKESIDSHGLPFGLHTQ